MSKELSTETQPKTAPSLLVVSEGTDQHYKVGQIVYCPGPHVVRAIRHQSGIVTYELEPVTS